MLTIQSQTRAGKILNAGYGGVIFFLLVSHRMRYRMRTNLIWNKIQNLETVSGSFRPTVVSVESFRLELILPIFGRFALDRFVVLA